MNPSSPQESVAGQSGSAATTPADSPTVAKVIVAVHGIGDQTRNATIQSVVARFCSHHGYPAIVPLGAFQQTLRDNNPAFVLQGPPPNPGLVGVIGFAEVYWAVIPRRIVSHGYTLQETKEWAKSIVARVGVLARSRAINSPVPGFDHKQVREVLEDLITAISVIEALTFLARKAEIIDFSLKKLLDDYLGDIQIMTEFAPQREQIVGEFREIMD